MPTTAYMDLNLPDVSVTIGPDWASDINTAITTIDAHDHSAGKGVQIGSPGINIASDFSMNGYNLIEPRSVRLKDNVTAITGASDLNILHCAGGNLYYRDGAGNQIQLTVGGALNASSVGGFGGDYGTSTASAFYTTASTKFTFWSNTNVPAIMDFGTIIIRKVTASGNGISIVAASAISGDYTLTLPAALPGATSLLLCDTSGNISFSTAPTLTALTVTGAVDFSTGSINSGSANKVIDAYTRTTGTSVSARGVAISADSGAFSLTSNTMTDITNLSVTITVTSRPVVIKVLPKNDSSANSSSFVCPANTTDSLQIQILRAGSKIAMAVMRSSAASAPADIPYFETVDNPGAGTFTYKAQVRSIPSATAISVNYCVLVAYEL